MIVDWLEDAATPRTAIAALAVFVVATVLVQTVGVRPRVESMAGGLALPETMVAYSPAEVDAVLDALGPTGRELYTQALLVDFVFVLTFVAGLGIPLAYLLPRMADSTRALAAAPIVAGVCDYVENVVLLYSINVFPDTSATAIWVASAFTTVKLVALIGSFVLVIVGVVVLGGRALLARV